MTRRFAGACMLILATGVFAAGCGGDDNNSSTSAPAATQTQAAGSESEGAKLACKGQAIQDSGLPAAFPAPGELTFTQSRKDGPSTVADGY